MRQAIEIEFLALSARAKIAVLSRTIHMETIYARAAHFDDPDDAKRIYQSSEFIHRLSGFIMALAYQPDEFQQNSACAAAALVEGIEPYGQSYLGMLHQWIIEAQPLP